MSKSATGCRMCGKEFMSVKNRMKHQKGFHDVVFGPHSGATKRRTVGGEVYTQKEFMCRKCNQSFPSGSERVQHQIKEHGVQFFKKAEVKAEILSDLVYCPKCGTHLTPIRAALQTH